MLQVDNKHHSKILLLVYKPEGDDDMLTSLLLSSSICSPNETSEAVVMAIINTLQKRTAP